MVGLQQIEDAVFGKDAPGQVCRQLSRFVRVKILPPVGAGKISCQFLQVALGGVVLFQRCFQCLYRRVAAVFARFHCRDPFYLCHGMILLYFWLS